jgi:plastocyanin
MLKFPALLFILLLCMALIAGCSIQTPPANRPAQATQVATQSATPVASGPTKEVSIIASSFDPAILNIRPGTTVVWTNEDRINHRIEHLPELPSDKLLFRSESLSPGQSFSYTFTQPGRYKYGDPQQAGGRTSLVIVE